MQRPLVQQEFTTKSFTVPVAPAAPLEPAFGLTALIDSFMITVPSTAANSVWLGSSGGVIVGSGIELLAGTTVQFLISHEGRQLYEIQNLLKKQKEFITCSVEPYEYIPFVCWDMGQIYLVAAAATAISVAFFKAVYI